MARYQITTPDGKRTFEIDGPDDATPDELQAFARQAAGVGDNYPVDTSGVQAQATSRQQDRDIESGLVSDVGQGIAELGKGFVQGAGHVVDQAADWAVSGLNGLGGLVGAGQLGTGLQQAGQSIGLAGDNNLSGAIAPAQQGYDGLRNFGEFAGEAAATSPLALLRAGRLSAPVQGLVGGALLSEKSDPIGVATDAGLGAVAGGATAGLLRAGARLANPEPVSNELRTLLDAGIRVDPGQVARSRGTTAGIKEATRIDRLTSAPFVGEQVIADRQGTMQDFGRAAINRALSPIKAALPDNVGAGRKAIQWAGDKLSDAYDALLPNLSATGDQQFLSDLSAIHGDAQMLAPDRVTQFNNTLRGLSRFFQNGQALDGNALKAIDTRLAERTRRFSASPDADQQDLGDMFQSVRDAVHDMLARQNPDYAGDLQGINKGWKGLIQAEKASGNSKAQITPAGYSQAVKQSSDTVRRRGYSRGEALNQDLSDAASEILPSDVPDSGTAGRWMEANKTARVKGAVDLARYNLAKAVQPAYLRQNNLSPGLARLLQYGAVTAPVVAPALIDQR